MARNSYPTNPLFNQKRNFQHNLMISDFISSSSTLKPRYPINYPYNIYDNENDSSGWSIPTIASQPKISHQNGTGYAKTEGMSNAQRRFWWWEPDPDSFHTEFLDSSTIHGLRYISEPKRHLLERIFWLVSFIASIAGASWMIKDIWQRYYNSPVIVTFHSEEFPIDQIPFPAVTICNTSPFKKTEVDKIMRRFKSTRTTQHVKEQALDSLRLINSICSSQPSFIQSLNMSSDSNEFFDDVPDISKDISPELESNLTLFLQVNAQPCRELLRKCVWAEEEVDCLTLFKPIITDYGLCCTFNMLPQQLLEKFASEQVFVKEVDYNYDNGFEDIDNENETDTETGTYPPPQQKLEIQAWTAEELRDWEEWNYNEDGYIISRDSIKFPKRQSKAGTTDGLTILLDPDVDENFCTSTDSLGVKLLFHVPLDVPRVADSGFVVGLNNEAFMEVNPDLTIADAGIETFSPDTRNCYIGKEQPLEFHKPYTRTNCLEECWSRMLMGKCGCVLYYTPHNSSTNVCSSHKGSENYICVKQHEKLFRGELQRKCKHCKYPCNELTYSVEATAAKLHPTAKLFANVKEEDKLKWMENKISIVHIFMGADSYVPKLRQKLYEPVDLIANTGGLLGLSIGFSILSLVEVLYFVTMRLCCKRLRKSKKYGYIKSSTKSDTQNIPDNNGATVGHSEIQEVVIFNRFPVPNNGIVRGSKNNFGFLA